MRSGGFPCRVDGCSAIWAVQDPKAMTSLFAASAKRTAHEEAVHGYAHQRLPEAPRRSSYHPRATPKSV